MKPNNISAIYELFFFYMFWICVIVNLSNSQDNFARIDELNLAIGWPGDVPRADANHALEKGENTMMVRSADNEVYYCVLPPELKPGGADEEEEEYLGPNEYTLLRTLFDQTTCSYRIESYWTYELCHGKHLRQYHEEREVNGAASPRPQEYTLGLYDRAKGDIENLLYEIKPDSPTEEVISDSDEPASDITSSGADSEIPPLKEPPTETPKTNAKADTVTIDGTEFVYYQLNFTNGTPCDLTNTPRSTAVRYVCHPDGRGEVYEIKETATCVYEIIVLTYTLCSHPVYKQKTKPVHQIKCHSLKGSPARPRSLQAIENEKTQSHVSKKTIKAKQEKKTVESPPVPVTNYRPGDETRGGTASSRSTRVSTNGVRVTNISPDNSLIKDFLRGDYCLTGGSGWWQYEFCFGRKATQFHVDRATKAKTIVLLGTWDEPSHLSWLQKNPNKQPASDADQRTSLSYMYVQGDTCDVTGHKRFVEVRMKCKQLPKSPNAVSIYLVEPRTCEYTLVIESALLCPVIRAADETTGLIDVAKYISNSNNKP